MKLNSSKPVQYQIAEFISKNLTRTIKNFTDQSPEAQCYSLFQNFRLVDNEPTGLRLTALGHKLMSRHFTATEFYLEQPITGMVLVNLDQAMKRPYYLSKKKVAFYDENDAAWFRLGGEDLKYFSGNL